jgi:phasin family protein
MSVTDPAIEEGGAAAEEGHDGAILSLPAPDAPVGDEATLHTATVESTIPEKIVEPTVSAINAGVAQANAGVINTQAKVKENMEKAMRTAQDMMSFSQGNFEAMIKSGQIWAAGVQDLTKQVAASAQAHMDEGMSAFKAMSSVKSLKEAIDLQTSLARNSMEKAVSETGRLTDASLKLAEEAIAPLTARVTLAVETFSKTA